MSQHDDCTARLNEVLASWGAQVAVHAGKGQCPDRPLLRVINLEGQDVGVRIAATFCPFCGRRLIVAAEASDLSSDSAVMGVWVEIANQARVAPRHALEALKPGSLP